MLQNLEEQQKVTQSVGLLNHKWDSNVPLVSFSIKWMRKLQTIIATLPTLASPARLESGISLIPLDILTLDLRGR